MKKFISVLVCFLMMFSFSFAEDMKKINDIFGHACQTPQIFSGMGLKHTVLGRGVNEHTAPPNFRWQSPDGSEVIAYRLRDYSGYLDFTEFAVTVPAEASDAELDRLVKEYFDELIEKAINYRNINNMDFSVGTLDQAYKLKRKPLPEIMAKGKKKKEGQK